MSQNECFLLFGGAGLVGRQVAYAIADKLSPRKIIIASLWQEEVETVINELKTKFADKEIEWEGCWGNIFVREEYAHDSSRNLLESKDKRNSLYNDLFGNLEETYETSQMVKIIQEHQPDVIIDSINTATAISYQDAYTASIVARRDVGNLFQAVLDEKLEDAQQSHEDANTAFDTLIISQALPQLVRHIQLLYKSMNEVGTRLYLKIGTTGTGGMGLNIPYTHSEDKPSVKLMTKTAVAFAHTGLMFLMARTPDAPIVKEIKPGGMIGYADVCSRQIREKGKDVFIYSSRTETLGDSLTLRDNSDTFDQIEKMELPIVDTGENGLFTKGEFEAITALRQMEFITPEEIARECMLEIVGSNTGFDVIASIDASIMNPTYRAGYLRHQVLLEMGELEKTEDTISVALGQLGPPELSKLLWEAELLQLEYGTLEAVLEHSPEDIVEALYKRVTTDKKIRRLITSIGLPVLTPDGKQLIRGPFIRIPEIPGETETQISPEDIDKWARKGWVDLRPQNFKAWQERLDRMMAYRRHSFGRGSAVINRNAYPFSEIRIGEIIAWIFNNEQGGYRIK
jgi:hypothetical protein